MRVLTNEGAENSKCMAFEVFRYHEEKVAVFNGMVRRPKWARYPRKEALHKQWNGLRKKNVAIVA